MNKRTYIAREKEEKKVIQRRASARHSRGESIGTLTSVELMVKKERKDT